MSERTPNYAMGEKRLDVWLGRHDLVNVDKRSREVGMRRSVLLGLVTLAASYLLPITVLLGRTQGQQDFCDQQNVNQKCSRVLASATSINGETKELTKADTVDANLLMSQQATLCY